MLEIHEVPGTNILELSIDGAIGTAEFDQVLARCEANIARYGKIRVLKLVRSLGGIPPSRWWEDVKFGYRHVRDVERAAIVAEPKWIEVFANLVNPFLAAEIRYFKTSELEAARNWLREGAEHSAG